MQLRWIFAESRFGSMMNFSVRRDESPENYCHNPGGVVVGIGGVVGVVRRQKF